MRAPVALSDRQCLFCAFRFTAPNFRSHDQQRASHSAPRRRLRETNKPRKPRLAWWSSDFSRRHQRQQGDEQHSPLPGSISFRPWKGEYADRASLSGVSVDRVTTAAAASLNTRSKDIKYSKTPEESVAETLSKLEKQFHGDEVFSRLKLSPAQLEEEFLKFKHKVEDATSNPLGPNGAFGKRLLLATRARGPFLYLAIKYNFFGQCFARALPAQSMLLDEKKMVNLRHPQEFYPATRRTKREWHLHVGPTNSGKTYHALKRLEEAETGIYAGPLRLLAHEVYLRLNAKGRHTNLVTGDDRRLAVGGEGTSAMSSCTVEMVPTNTQVDVAVIDEIQMIGSEDRGWAWTQALLGVKARELHMCGEERAVEIVQQLAALCGDTCHVHRYERLSPLKMAKEPLYGNLNELRKGDCVVAFSVVMIHSLRQAIEKLTGKKCAIIYGSLPPETRAQQAKLFNDPDNEYDILVASNAIGMGLNLSIKRLVFQDIWVTSGKAKMERIPISDIKQIAGRAGRFRTAEQGMKAATDTATVNTSPPKTLAGEVTTMEAADFDHVSLALRSDVEPIKAAGIQAPASVVERFARYFPPETPFSYIFFRLCEQSSTASQFFICQIAQNLSIADAIESVRDLSVADRMVICSSPVETRKPGEAELAQELAGYVAERKAITMVDIKCLDFSCLHDDEQANLANLKPSQLKNRLSRLERLHKAVNIYLWLSYRFILTFLDRSLAQYIKGKVEAAIEETLEKMSSDYETIQQRREKKLERLLAQANVEAERSSNEGLLRAAESTSTGHLAHDLERQSFEAQAENVHRLQESPA